jgi:hypothetical protein
MEQKHQSHKKLLKRKRKPSGGQLLEDITLEKNFDNEILEPKEKEKESKDVTKITLTNKKPNRKKLIKNRLEFLLSDINLYHDQFLRRTYLSNNKGVSPDIFLKCKSIKALLSDIEKNDKRRNELIKAVEISKDLVYNKASDKIKRKIPYNHKLIDIDLWDSCTIFIPNFPSGINQQMIYDIFPEYKILYINFLIKRAKKDDKKYKQAYIILKEKEDVEKIIKQYDGKQITKYKIFEQPIHIMAKANIKENNEIKENNMEIEQKKDDNKNNENKINDENNSQTVVVIEKNKLTEVNLNDNICMSFNGLKDDIKLLEFIKILEQLEKPLFVDLDRNKNSAILRFKSKKESDSFLRKFYNGGGESLKGMFKYDKINKPRVFSQKENNDYLEMVKEKLQTFKTDKLNKKLKKLKLNK